LEELDIDERIILKMVLQQIRWEDMDRIALAQDMDKWW
jgi:hypothetical protein